jgi:hypothetical protein
VRIRALLVDGQLLRWDAVQRGPGWHEFRPDPFPRLAHDGTTPSAVEFAGKHVVVVLEGTHNSREVELLRNGEVQERIDLYTDIIEGVTADRPRTIVSEVPAAKPPAWMLPAFFVAFLALLAAARPWASPTRTAFWVLLHLVVVNLLAWTTQPVTVTNDSIGYITGSEEFFKGKATYFPPGYSFLVGLVDVVPFLGLGRLITLLQHAMMVVAGWWLFRLLSRSLGQHWAFVAAVVAGSLATTMFMPLSVMSETLAAFTCMGAVYFAVRASEAGSGKLSVVSGLLAGWAGLARVVPVAAVCPAIACVHLLPPTWRGLRLAGVSFLSVALVLLPPMLWLKVRDDQFALSNSVGGHLFNRVVHAQGLVDRNGQSTVFVIHAVGDREKWPNHILTRMELEKKGIGYYDALELLGNMAKEAIEAHPLEYTLFSFEIAWRQLFTDPYLHRWPQVATPLDHTVEKPPLIGLTKGSLDWRMALERFQALVWEPLGWTALVGLLLLFFPPIDKRLLALACIPVGTLLASAFVENVYDRYAAPLVPFLVALAVTAMARLERFVGRLRGARATEAQLDAAQAEHTTGSASA